MLLSLYVLVLWLLSMIGAVRAHRRFASARDVEAWTRAGADRPPAWVTRSFQTAGAALVLVVVAGICDALVETDAERAAYRRELRELFERVSAEERARKEAQAADAPDSLRAPRDRDARDE